MRDLKGMRPLTCRAAILILALIFSKPDSYAQETVAPAVTKGIRTGGIVIDGDTLAFFYLDNVDVVARLPRRFARRREEWNRLKFNIWKVYPYAVSAAEILKDVDVELEKRSGNKRARKEYLNSLEKKLNAKFKGELENLSIKQGQLLVKLINRQTGKNCFSLIQELKSGFSAVVWQSVALVFSNNLKREYDPTDRDSEIEKIVADLETAQYYQYQYQRQQVLQRKR